MFRSINQKLPYKSIRAINDENVLKFLDSIFRNKGVIEVLKNKQIEKSFLNQYKKWILSSKLNKLNGLNNFKFLNYANGSSQIFDYFYDKNK
ncbi:hypothetical protein OAX12_03610, partial [Candidatus Pelagibacter sp.]|nr:hypothetical protein [Candidatus Pelagibacter sp.]